MNHQRIVTMDASGRVYPCELAGELYPKGIPIYPEEELVELIHAHQVDQVIFAYSDIPHEYVTHKASIVLSAGADFRLMGLKTTQLAASKPVISACAARTGSDKSQTSWHVAAILRDLDYKGICNSPPHALWRPCPTGRSTLRRVRRFEAT